MTGTQQFIPIEDIRDNLVFLKNGAVSLVINTSAVNFGLLFETEQLSIIGAFAGLLNSLSFPIQIVISSKRLDVSSYLKVIDHAYGRQTNPLLKTMTVHYRRFVESLIRENNVLDKQFYVCLSVASIELGVLPKNLEERAKRAVTILTPRRDHLLRQLTRLGLKARQLGTIELVKLFYDIYNEYSYEAVAPQPQPARPSVPPSNSPPPQIVPAALHPLRAFPQSLAPAPAAAPPKSTNPVPPAQTTLAPPFVVEELPDEYDHRPTS